MKDLEMGLNGPERGVQMEDGFREKQIKWNEVEERMDALVDEKEILEPVMALNAVGLSTTNSCEGHADHGRIVPWITIGAPNFPKEKYVGQKEFEEKVYEENGISRDLLKRQKDYAEEFDREKIGLNAHDFGKLAENLMEKHEISYKDFEKVTKIFFDILPKRIENAVASGILHNKTQEYIQWVKEQEKLKEKTKAFLNEFYDQDGKKDVPENVKLILEEGIHEGAFFLRNDGGGDYVELDQKMTEEESNNYQRILSGEKKELLQPRIESYRKEFKEFAQFLKNKFFEE